MTVIVLDSNDPWGPNIPYRGSGLRKLLSSTGTSSPMFSSVLAKNDVGESKAFQRVEPRATEDNRLGAYSPGTEQGPDKKPSSSSE